MTMKSLQPQDLNRIVTDASELAKGIRIRDDGGLAHLARFENKLFADAKGSGAAPYKVQIIYDDGENKFKGRCSCMAARSRPFCKHATALLAAWATTPKAFAMSEAPPQTPPGEAKKTKVKTGKVETKNLMSDGIAQAGTLVRELAISGLATLSRQRVGQINALAVNLRENKLRRLSARLQALTDLISTKSSDEKSRMPVAEQFSDAVLTIRKLEKHLAGEELEPRYVEELIGKSWTKKDRSPVEKLDLVEYAYIRRKTADDFIIRESRFIDLNNRTHYSEKQILPAFLAKRMDPKPGYAGTLLAGAGGGVFPGFAPFRIDLEDKGKITQLTTETLERLLNSCLTDVGAALAMFQERRADVFAPDETPVGVLAEAIFVRNGRMQVVDRQGSALFLPAENATEDALAYALRGQSLAALFGDIVLSGALPTLVPLAALVRSENGLQLKPIIASFRSENTEGEWILTARAAGVSAAAISLGEIREELAFSIYTGLGTIDPRSADALVSRLKEMGLTKQGELLEQIAQRKNPEEKLDDAVKLFHILGIALARLSAASQIDRSALAAVPTFESVFVRKPEKNLSAEETARAFSAGEINRYEAALHYTRYYGSLPAEQLEREIYPIWADGTATPYVAHALAANEKRALAICENILREGNKATQYGSRMVQLTALHVLRAIKNKDAEKLLRKLSETQKYAGVAERAFAGIAQRFSRELELNRSARKALLDEKEAVAIGDALNQAINARDRQARMAAMTLLTERGALEMIPQLRSIFYDDASHEVRDHAAFCLACLGDFESVPVFLKMLAARHTDDSAARLAARALGILGDLRGLHELLNAWEESWAPQIVYDSLRAIGPSALEPLSLRLETKPELLKKKAVLGILQAWDIDEIMPIFEKRLAQVLKMPHHNIPLYALGKMAEAHEKLAGIWTRSVVRLDTQGKDIARQYKRLTSPPEKSGKK